MKQPRQSSTRRINAPTASALLRQSSPGADTPLTCAQEELMEELSPLNPIAASIARDIIMVDCDLALLPKRRNAILWQLAITPMYELILREGVYDEHQAKDLALLWAKGSQDAEAAIVALGIDPTIAHNQAYMEYILLIGEIDKQIERLERRRRQLLADYRLINTKGKNYQWRSPREIDDAEIISVLEGGDADAGQGSPRV